MALTQPYPPTLSPSSGSSPTPAPPQVEELLGLPASEWTTMRGHAAAVHARAAAESAEGLGCGWTTHAAAEKVTTAENPCPKPDAVA